MNRYSLGWGSAASFALAMTFAGSPLAAPGDLDATFGTAGVARFATGTIGSTSILSASRQADGKVLVAGEVHATSGPSYAIVGRVNPDGSMDASFGNFGWSALPSATSATAVAPAAQGKTLVGLLLPNGQPAMGRLNADGTRDTIVYGSPQDFAQSYNAYNLKITAIAEHADGSMYWSTNSADDYGYDAQRSSLFRFNSYGFVDYSYGNNGRADFELGIGYEKVRAMLVMGDGSILVGGWASSTQYSTDLLSRDAVVARVSPSGALDPAFGSGGKVVVDFNGGADEIATLALDPQGRVIAAGKAGYANHYGGESAFGVLRLNAQTGALDASFGSAGTRQFPVAYYGYPDGEESVAQSIVVLPGGDIIVGGRSRPTYYYYAGSRALIARLDPDGQGLVATFGQQGIAVIDPYYSNNSDALLAVTADSGSLLAIASRLPNNDSMRPMTLLRQRFFESTGGIYGDALTTQAPIPGTAFSFMPAVAADGRIVIAGEQAAFARVYGRLANGAQGAYLGYMGNNQYSGFAEFQVDTRTTRSRAVTFDSAGRMVVGSVYGDQYQAKNWVVSRFELSRGFLDSTWGTQGHARLTSLDGDVAAVAVQPDGKVVVAGSAKNLYSVLTFAVARFNSDGTPDTTFGSNGVLVLPSSFYDEYATALAVQPDGKLLIGGYTSNPTQMKVARVTASGALDTTWGQSGVMTVTHVGASSVHALAIQADGKVLAGGSCGSYPGRACVARFTPSGSLDPLFGYSSAVVSVPPPLGESFITGIAWTGDGKIVAAGDSQGDAPFAVRWLETGEFDSSYQGLGFTVPQVTAGNWNAFVEPTGRVLLAGVAENATGGEVVMVRLEGEPVDTDPDAFSFTDRLGVPTGQVIVSNAVTISGITAPAAISVLGGEYSIGCTAAFTFVASTIAGGQTVCVRHTSSSVQGSTVDTTLTIGTVSDTFSSTTGTLPETSLTTTPPLASASRAATFSFTSTDTTATFRCSLDNAAFAACASPATFTSLADGSHGFKVAAVNATGIDASPAEYSWTIDASPPDTTVNSGPGPVTNQATATLNFSGSDAPGGYGNGLTFECRLDGGAFAPCTSPLPFTGISDGAHTFAVRATDPLGNVDPTPATWSWTVDLVAPQTTIVSGPPAITNSPSFTVTLASDDPGATFECDGSGTGNSFYPCQNPVVVDNPTLADGTYTLYFRAKDAVGNVDPTPASLTFTLDRTPPNTYLESPPTGITNSTSATLVFGAMEGGATLECSLDAAPFAACTSPATYSGLADGVHTFAARAKDAAGNVDASPIAVSWTVDATAPDTSITNGPSGTVNLPTATFMFTSPNPPVVFECSLDAAPFTACGAGSSIFYSGLADGMHMFEVRARDGAGNADPTPATRTWSVDSTAPDTTITNGPDAVTEQTSATFGFTATEAGGFYCTLDNAAPVPCTSPLTYTGLAQGSHSFTVFGVDAAQNGDPSPATWNWVIDNTVPETTISIGPSGLIPSANVSFYFTSNEPAATFQCAIDGGPFTACVSPKDYSGLPDGTHLFEVFAKDAAGHFDSTPDSRTFTVDTTAPETSITSAPAAATNQTSATFQFTSTELGTFDCKLDGGGFAACTSPKTYTGLAVGSHTFQVRARDSLNHIDATPASFTWTIDTTPPATFLTGGPSGNNNPNTATFTFASSESPGLFDCKLDTGAYAACTSPKTYNGLMHGSHTFTVRARDAAGNVDTSPVSRNWSVK